VSRPLKLLAVALPLLAAPAVAGAAPPTLDVVVGKTVRGSYATLHRCFRKALAGDRSRSGTVFIQATLGQDDRVTGAKAVRDELDHLPTARCLVAKVVKWTFPGAAAAGAGKGSEVVIPLTLRPDPGQFTVNLGDVDPSGAAPAVRRAIITRKNLGASRAEVTHLTLSGSWTAAAPAGRDLAVVVLEGTAGKGLAAGAALWLPSGARRALKGKGSLLVISSPAMKGKAMGKKPRVVAPPEPTALQGGKLKVTPLLGRPGAGTGGTYVGWLEAAQGFDAKPHHHDTADELVFIVRGAGAAMLQDREVPVAAGDAMNLPAREGHGMKVSAAMKVVQIYAPGGAEARFYRGRPGPAKKGSKKGKR